MTQNPTMQTPGQQVRAPSAPDASAYSVEELAKVVAMAEKQRRRFELDPRGYVEEQVRTKLRQLNHQGLLRNQGQEAQARLFFAGYYQEQGGIENPRLLSNQERAELVQDFLRADLPARVDLMEGLESVYSKEWPKAFGELVNGLPHRERAVARRTFERFEHHRLHSVDPEVGLNIDAWSGALDEVPTLPEYPKAQNFGAAEPATGFDTKDKAEPPSALPDIGAAASALPSPSVVPGVTDDWTGPGLDAERSAFLAGLVEEILAAAPEDLPALEQRIEASFEDDPFSVQRVVSLARARFGEGSEFLVPVGESQTQAAEAALRGLLEQLRSGRDYNDQRREDRAAFAAMEAASGLRLRLQDDGKVSIGEPDQPPLAVVSWSVARAIARDPEEVRERFALIDSLISSRDPDHALRDEIDQALGLITVDEGGEPTDFEATRQAVLAARAAIREGHDLAAVRAGLIATFFPEVTRDPIAWGELLLDVLPIIGEIRSAGDAIESLDAMAEALARGNLGEAAKQGLLGALATAGAVPAIGPLFKTLRTLTVRALRTRAVSTVLRTSDLLKKVHGRFAVAQRRGRMPAFIRHIKAKEAFAEVWPRLTADQKKLLNGLMPHLKGKPVELDFVRLLENAGMDIVTTGQDKLLLASGKKTILDAVSRNGFSDGFRILANSFILTTPGAKGTIFEFKLGDASPTANQMAGKSEVELVKARGKTVTTEGGISAVDYEVLRYGFDEVPEDVIAKEAERLLRNHANGKSSKRLTHADVDELVQVFVGWHRQLRHDTAGEVMTVAEALIALGIAAGQRAARNALGAGADESEPKT